MSLDLIEPENFSGESVIPGIYYLSKKTAQKKSQTQAKQRIWGAVFLAIGIIAVIIVAIFWTNKKLSRDAAFLLLIGSIVGVCSVITCIFLDKRGKVFFTGFMWLGITIANIFLIVSSFRDNGIIWLFFLVQVLLNIMLFYLVRCVPLIILSFISYLIMGYIIYYRLK